jgi:DNA polymerase I-like protein with 3'-5' exonuclease and polymerase domains
LEIPVTDLFKLSEELSDLTSHDKILYLKTEPDITNFTRPFPGTLYIYGQKKKIAVTFVKESIVHVYNQLKESVFNEKITTIFWNVKNLVTFFKFHTSKNIVISSKVLDLKLIEAFLGIKQGSPSSLSEALRRLTPYINNEEVKRIHNKIHKPLALEVVPSMETYKGVIDTSLKKYVYPSYEIEGQSFGRLNCHKDFDNCIVPLTMGSDRKETLRLQGDREFFVNFDFKHMEVSMLQWLTGDPVLKHIIDSKQDMYKGIYQVIFGEACDTEVKRELIKSLFLPIMFGQTSYGLEKEYGVSAQAATQLHCLIKEKFKTSWQYMEDNHERVKSAPTTKDYFGRIRSFTEKPNSVRGFMIQAASAVFCQEKLIELYNSLNGYGKLLYSIHDGYVLVANQENLNKVVVNSLKALQSESKMCKGLNIKVVCSIGLLLSRLKQVPVSKEKNGDN